MCKRTVFGVATMLLLIVISLEAIIAMGLSDPNKEIKNIDCEPPEIIFNIKQNIITNKTEKRVYFKYVVSDIEHGRSKILGTEVWLFRTPREGEWPLAGFGEGIVDPSSGLSYQIAISLEDIDESTDKDDEGLIEVKGTGMDFLHKEYLEDKTAVAFSGSFDFSTTPIRLECKYYMIILAIDYYINIRYGIWDVTDFIHSIVGESQPNIRTPLTPKIGTPNIHGKIELGGWISHYFLFKGEPRIPWIRLDGGIQRCFILTVRPCGHKVEMGVLGIFDSDVIFGKVFVAKCYGLWKYGRIVITVDGNVLMEIVFLYTIGPYTSIVIFLAIPLITVVVWYFTRKRIKLH